MYDAASKKDTEPAPRSPDRSSDTYAAYTYRLLTTEKLQFEQFANEMISHLVRPDYPYRILPLKQKKVDSVVMCISKISLLGKSEDLILKLYFTPNDKDVEAMRKLVSNEVEAYLNFRNIHILTHEVQIDGVIAKCALFPFIEGNTLYSFIRDNEIKTQKIEKRFSIALELISQIASEFLMIRSYEYIHGDPHPGNLLVRFDKEGDIICELFDFALTSRLYFREDPPLSLRSPLDYQPIENTLWEDYSSSNLIDIAGIGRMGEEILNSLRLLPEISDFMQIRLRQNLSLEAFDILMHKTFRYGSSSIERLSKRSQYRLERLRLTFLQMQAPSFHFEYESKIIDLLNSLKMMKNEVTKL